MSCDCCSYNRPDWGGTVEEIVVTVPVHLRVDGRETICLDLCIAPVVLSLWTAGVRTFGSCCGHRGNAPRAIVIDGADVPKARSALWPGETARLAFWQDGVLRWAMGEAG